MRTGHTTSWLGLTVLVVVACRGRIKLPLPDVPPPAAKLLRTQFVEDTMDFFVFLVMEASSTAAEAAIDASMLGHLFTFLLAFTSNISLVQSPHLRAKFGDVTYQIFIPAFARQDQSASVSPGVAAFADSMLRTHADGLRLLAPSLARLYGDVEQTGIPDKLYHRCVGACSGVCGVAALTSRNRRVVVQVQDRVRVELHLEHARPPRGVHWCQPRHADLHRVRQRHHQPQQAAGGRPEPPAEDPGHHRGTARHRGMGSADGGSTRG